MKKSILKWLLVILRLTLGGIFIYACLYKIQTPGAFAEQIYKYKILPWWMINPLAIMLPWLQLLCGLCLIFNVWPETANGLILSMMVVFQMALASALIRHLNVTCGCFKSGGDSATWITFGRDSLILLTAVTYQVLLFKSKKTDQ